MNRMFLSILIFILYDVKSFSQNCDPATVGQLPGNWKAGLKNPSSNTEAAALAKAKKITDLFHTRIRQNYSPVGLQAKYSFSRVDKEYHLKLYSFWYRLAFHPFYCYKNAVTPQFEPSGLLMMKINPGIFYKGEGWSFWKKKTYCIMAG